WAVGVGVLAVMALGLVYLLLPKTVPGTKETSPKTVATSPAAPQEQGKTIAAPIHLPATEPSVIEGPTKIPPEPVKNRFTKAKDGVICDSATGLEWFVGPDRDTSWNQAKFWTESLTATGGGWRMPTVPELKTLYLPGASSNNMDPIFQLTGYWIWTGQMKDASMAWGFSFKAGRGLWDRLDDAANGRTVAVRSLKETPPELQPVKTRFTKAKDEVITDSVTGLDWYIGPDQNTSWNQAKAWTENLTAAEGGWRMPTVQELKALYQPGAGPSNIDPIFQTTGTWVWSGQLRDASSALCFSFRYGKEHWWRLAFAYNGRVFAVRSRIGSLIYNNPPETLAKSRTIQITGDTVLSATNGWCVDTGGNIYTIGEEVPDILENILKKARDQNLKVVVIGDPGKAYREIGQKIQYDTIYVVKIGFRGHDLVPIPRYHGR
ncbi:MAG: DUF1566 domain-containing protein, partial [Desulfobaccales bacterium]